MEVEEIAYETRGQVLIVHLPTELDHHFSKNIKDTTQEFLSISKIDTIVFDFSSTRFMDSSGIGVLLGRYKQMKALGGEVAICGVSDRIDRILKMSGIYQIIPRVEE